MELTEWRLFVSTCRDVRMSSARAPKWLCSMIYHFVPYPTFENRFEEHDEHHRKSTTLYDRSDRVHLSRTRPLIVDPAGLERFHSIAWRCTDERSLDSNPRRKRFPSSHRSDPIHHSLGENVSCSLLHHDRSTNMRFSRENLPDVTEASSWTLFRANPRYWQWRWRLIWNTVVGAIPTCCREWSDFSCRDDRPKYEKRSDTNEIRPRMRSMYFVK